MMRSNPTNPTVVRAKKSLGQHFLHDERVIQSIVEAALNSEQSGRLVEIGPGLGALTNPLVLKGAHLHLIELDDQLFERLQQDGRLQAACFFIHQDALQYDFTGLIREIGPIRIIGNLPYNIATALIAKLLLQELPCGELLVMLQKEVAARLCALPGSPARGRLSLLAEYFCQKRTLLFDVPPEAFSPPPAVDSTVIHLIPFSDRPSMSVWDKVSHLCQKGFHQRRKMLRKSLKGFERLEYSFATLQIDPTHRPGDLTLEEWGKLASMLIP